MRRLTVCVPSRSPARLGTLLRSMAPPGLAPDPATVRVIVGDNGLGRVTLPAWVHRIPVPDPFVFAAAINRCVAARLEGSDLLLLNDDVLIATPAWSESLRMTMSLGPAQRYGIVSPVVVGAVGNHDQLWPVPTGDIWMTRQPICFLSAFIRAEVWDTVGPLDEQFNAYGCEDVDYCRRTVDAGWKLGVVGGVMVAHPVGSSTYQEVLGARWEAEGRRARAIFEAKWGLGPQLGAYEERFA